MSKHTVKCPVCGEQFIREDVEYIHMKNRYYHKNCYEKMIADQETIENIHSKMRELCGDAYSKKRIDDKIVAYRQLGFSAEGIKKSLDYWYDVRQEDPANSYGSIGIVEYIYNEALEYWKEQEEQNNKFSNVDFDKLNESLQAVTVKVKPTHTIKPKRTKLFKLN